MITNYYQCLQLAPRATQQEVAENYRKLALRYHPKSTKEAVSVANKMFSQLAQAYEVLKDPVKRAFYDKYGYEALRQGLYGGGELKAGYRFAGNAEEIFDNFFTTSQQMSRVLDLSVKSTGGLFGHALGGLNYKDNLICDNLIVKVPCTLQQLNTGANKLVTYSRKTLNGDGRTTSMQLSTKTIHIKQGYDSKTVLNFPGEGHQTVHGVVSDLLFCIDELPDMTFVRKGDDLVYTHWIKLAEAFSCCSISLTTLDNRVISVGVDELVSPKTIREVQGEGMPNTKTGTRGSLFIRFGVIFPQQLSQQTRCELRSLLQK